MLPYVFHMHSANGMELTMPHAMLHLARLDVMGWYCRDSLLR